MRKLWPLAWTIGLLLVPTQAASAHPAQFTTLQIEIEPTGRFQGDLNIDILSFALGQTSIATTNEQLEAVLYGPRTTLGQLLSDAGDRFRREVVIHTDAGDVVPTSWQLPGLDEVNAVLARKIQPPILMPGDISFSGTLPADAHTISIRLPYVLGDTVQVYELPNGESDDEPVAAGDYSSDIKLNLAPPETASRFSDFRGYVALALLLSLLAIYCFFRRPMRWMSSSRPAKKTLTRF